MKAVMGPAQRAEFEGWILKDHKPVKGPFEIEIWCDNKAGWISRLMPTAQRIGNRGFKTQDEIKSAIAALFQKQTKDWRAV